jgi:hypothetical protein
MTVLPLSRLSVVGALLFLPGLYYTLRFFSGCLRMLYRKFRKGRAYLKGSATDYLVFALGSLCITLAGGFLLAASVLQGGLQAYDGTVEIGSVRAESREGGRMHLTFDLTEAHPVRQRLEADLQGARWALQGEFLRWRGVPRWLGFASAHRVEAALASNQAMGSPDRPEDHRTPVAGTYEPWYLTSRHPRWVPMAAVQSLRTPWLAAEGATFKIVATDEGYVLVEERERDRKDAPGGQGESPSGSH